MQIIHELRDMRYLEWTKTRHSSGTAGSFLKAYEKVGGRKYYYKLSNYDSINGMAYPWSSHITPKKCGRR